MATTSRNSRSPWPLEQPENHDDAVREELPNTLYGSECTERKHS